MNPVLFLLRVLGAMVPVFFLWWVIGSVWLQPAVNLTDYLLSEWFPQTFDELKFFGDTVTALTHWQLENNHFVPAAMTASSLDTDVNIRILSYSFPFFLSLQLALWEKNRVWKVILSLLTLYFVLIVSLAFIVAKRMLINLQLEQVFVETTLYWYANPEFIILGYQAATLLLPTLIPMLLWVVINQSRLKMFIVK